jgi:hypothetical protein
MPSIGYPLDLLRTVSYSHMTVQAGVMCKRIALFNSGRAVFTLPRSMPVKSHYCISSKTDVILSYPLPSTLITKLYKMVLPLISLRVKQFITSSKELRANSSVRKILGLELRRNWTAQEVCYAH